MKDWPTPEAPAAPPLKGVPPAARQSRIHGVWLAVLVPCQSWSV